MSADLNQYSEGTTGRTLTTGMATTGGGNALTVALCTTACKAGGFKYAGVEYASECCELVPPPPDSIDTFSNICPSLLQTAATPFPTVAAPPQADVLWFAMATRRSTAVEGID